MAALRESGPFDVSVDALKRLKPDEAVELFHELISAESARTDRPIAAANVPRAITTADGGVDGEIDLGPGALIKFGLLRQGRVRYQIKTGSFSASTPGDIKSLLLKPSAARVRKLTPEHLNERVKSCLDNGGVFVAVLFGSDAVGKADDYGVKELKALAVKIDPKYAACSFEVLRANQLTQAITAISPATALRLNGLAGLQGAPFHQLKYMAESCSLEVDKFQATLDLDASVKDIVDEANALRAFRHIRVLGDAGSGKTHLVYRALEQSSSSHHVLYCQDSEVLASSGSFAQLLELSRTASVILVADECDVGNAAALQARLKKVAANFLLITIFNQRDGDDSLGSDVPLVDVPPLAVTPMAKIFASYSIQAERQEWLAKLCEGSPRAAHLIGQHIQRNPAVDYADHFPKLDGLWETIICSPETRDSDVGGRRLTVARCVALFRDLYWGRLDEGSSKKIFELVVHRVDPRIAPATLEQAISSLRARRVLQGINTLYLSPKLLHIKLWSDWWEKFDHHFDEQWFRENLTSPMMDKLFAMFEFAKESQAATRMVERMLAAPGPFASLSSFAAKGNAALFFALAQADSKAALRRLRYTLESSSAAELKVFREGRREVVHGLERLAIPEENFPDAAECLLLLAEHENENWSNNATGTFVSLFSLGYGKMAASEMSPLMKLPFLEEQLRYGNSERRALVIKALSESLSPFMSRVDIGESSGLRFLPNRWSPQTYNDLWVCYAGHVDLLVSAFDFLSGDERKSVAYALMNHIRSLFLIPLLEERLVKALRHFSTVAEIKGAVVEKVASVIHYEGKALRAPLQAELITFLKQLTETTFHDRMQRHVGLKLLEDSFDETGEYSDAPKEGLLQLRDEALESPALLSVELPWVVTSEAKNGYQFGELLGAVDQQLSLFTPIFRAWHSAQQNRSDFFFGGYLRGLFNQDEGLWSLTMGELFETVENGSDLLVLVWRSGMSEEVSRALLELMRNEEIAPKEFRILVYGAVVRLVPMPVLREILNVLIASPDPQDADTALDLFQSRRRSRPDDEAALIDLLFPTLRHPSYFSVSQRRTGSDHMRSYHWNDGAKLLLKKNPKEALMLAHEGLQTFGKAGTITEAYGKEGTAFFDEVIKSYPNDIWPAIAARLELKGNSNSYRMLSWLRGSRNDGGGDEPSGLELMPFGPIVEWIKGDAKHRAPLIAEFCPPVISEPFAPEKSLLRVVLENFGAQRKVRGAAHASSLSGFFTGPISHHYTVKRDGLNRILAAEQNAHVRLWLKEAIASLDNQIEAEKEREDASQ